MRGQVSVNNPDVTENIVDVKEKKTRSKYETNIIRYFGNGLFFFFWFSGSGFESRTLVTEGKGGKPLIRTGPYLG